MVLLITSLFGVLYLSTFVRATKGKGDIFAAPCFVGPMFFYLFTANAFICYFGPGNSYLQERDFIIGQVIAGVSYICFLLGWRWTAAVRTPHEFKLNENLLNRHGLFWAAVGLVGWSIFVLRSGGLLTVYGAVHGSGADWTGNTAYLYQMILFAWPGLIFLLIGAFRDRNVCSRPMFWAVLLTMLLLADAVLQGDRGDFFRTTMPWLLVPFLVHKKRPSPIYFAIAGVIIASVIGMLVVYRAYLCIGADRSDVAQASVVRTFFSEEEGQPSTGNEYLLHCARVSYSLRALRFAWGKAFLYPALHVIPRIIWKTKPDLSEFAPPVMSLQDWDNEYGWTPAYGSAGGGVAVLFEQLFVVSFALWLAFGMITRRLFDLATKGYSTLGIAKYVSLIVCSLWLIMQGWFSFFMAICYFFLPYFVYQHMYSPVWRRESRRHWPNRGRV